MRSRKSRILSAVVLVLLTLTIGAATVIWNGEKMCRAEALMSSNGDWGELLFLQEIGEHVLQEEFIRFQVLDGETLIIDSHKMYDNYDTRWELAEIDAIMNSLEGTWQADSYQGFVLPELFYSELNVRFDTWPENVREEYAERYQQHVQAAQEHVPDYLFTIEKNPLGKPGNNYIYVTGKHGRHPSWVNISFHRNSFNEIFAPGVYDTVCISSDFQVEYPVLYLQFFICYEEEDEIERYRPATFVVTADKQFMVQLDGAFYSLKQVDTDTLQ